MTPDGTKSPDTVNCAQAIANDCACGCAVSLLALSGRRQPPGCACGRGRPPCQETQSPHGHRAQSGGAPRTSRTKAQTCSRDVAPRQSGSTATPTRIHTCTPTPQPTFLCLPGPHSLCRSAPPSLPQRVQLLLPDVLHHGPLPAPPRRRPTLRTDLRRARRVLPLRQPRPGNPAPATEMREVVEDGSKDIG